MIEKSMPFQKLNNGETINHIEQWDIFELTLSGTSTGNPYVEVHLSATFVNGSNKIEVDGFYDGDGIYRIRFMPHTTGEWKYTTASNDKNLSGVSGGFICINPSVDNHGPVKVKNRYHFEYSDGKPFYPFGTTCYAWIHQGDSLEAITLNTLSTAPFNKIRMCVFPKRYRYNENEPKLYPFKLISKKKSLDEKQLFVWDFTKFAPEFFRHLENRIEDLMKLGIEADVILFHPYDKGHWGFDRMSHETDLFYLKYVISRLSAYRNIWWSLANEYDYMKEKKYEDWDDFIQTIVTHDPYHHLCSIHNAEEYFDTWNTQLTHASVQNGSLVEDFGRAVTLRNVYKKPVIYDEVGYEGNFPERWGDLSAEEMTHCFWQGIIAGTYVTHGETYLDAEEIVWWAKGGVLHGTSPAHIAFLQSIIEETGYLEMVDKWKDHQTATTAGNEYILIYFGKEIKNEWPFSLPAKSKIVDGTKFGAEIIDTWNMTITSVNDTFVTEKKAYRLLDMNRKRITLPAKPYLAIRLKKIIPSKIQLMNSTEW